MVRKKIKQQLDNLERKIKEFENRNRVLTHENDRLTSLTREYEKILASSDRRASMAREVIGERTFIDSQIAIAIRYARAGEYLKAKKIFDIIFEGKNEDKIHFFLYEDRRNNKELFWLDRKLSGIDEHEHWLCIRYANEELPRIPWIIYQQSMAGEGRDKNTSEPNFLETIAVINYLLTKKISGINLFDFFKKLEELPNTTAKAMLRDALLEEQLKETAYVKSLNYGLSPGLIIHSSHEKKAIEVFEKAGRELKADEKNKLIQLVKPINTLANSQFRDAASWNYYLAEEKISYLLSDSFISQQNPNNEEIRMLVRKSIFPYDFDKLSRMTFPCDDAIHVLEWAIPLLKPKDRAIKENYFVNQLARRGVNVGDYWIMRHINGFYRHLRMWHFFQEMKDKYPDADDRFKNHHLRMAFSELYIHTFGKYPSKAQPESSILFSAHNQNHHELDKILELLMDANCRPQTIKYPTDDAEKTKA